WRCTGWWPARRIAAPWPPAHQWPEASEPVRPNARSAVDLDVWVVRNARELGVVSRGRRILSAEDQGAIAQVYRRFRQDREDGRPHEGTDGLSFAVDAAQIAEPDYSLNPLDHQIGRE